MFKKILFIRALYFERKKESEIKFWTFVLTWYTWNTVSTNWRIWYCLKTTVRKFSNSNIGAVNAIQKKFVYLHEIKSKVHLKLERYCSKFILLQFSFDYNPAFYFNIEKSYEDIYHSPPHVSVITGKILITICCYHPLLAFNSTFMTGSVYLGTIQICRNLNEHHCYLILTTSVIWQIDTNCSPPQSLNMFPFHIRLERLKLIY